MRAAPQSQAALVPEAFSAYSSVLPAASKMTRGWSDVARLRPSPPCWTADAGQAPPEPSTPSRRRSRPFLELGCTIPGYYSCPRGGSYVPLGTGSSSSTPVRYSSFYAANNRSEALTLRRDPCRSRETTKSGETLTGVCCPGKKMVGPRLRDVSRQER